MSQALKMSNVKIFMMDFFIEKILLNIFGIN